MHADGLTAKQTISLLVPIADALDAAHAVDIVHRDVKPQNIIISTDAGHPYLTDFGIAKGVATAVSARPVGSSEPSSTRRPSRFSSGAR